MLKPTTLRGRNVRTVIRILGIGILLTFITVGITAVIGLLTGSGPLAATYTKVDGSPVPFGELLFFCGAISAALVILPAIWVGHLIGDWLPQLPYGLLTALRVVMIAALLIPIAFTAVTLVRAILDVHPHGWTFIVTEVAMIFLFVILPAVGIGHLIVGIAVSKIKSETAAS
jgi:hypothetical protein